MNRSFNTWTTLNKGDLTLSSCDLQSLYCTYFNLPTQTTHPPHHALPCRTYCHPSSTPNSSIHITIYIMHKQTGSFIFTLLVYHIIGQCISLSGYRMITYVSILEEDGQTSGFVKQAGCIRFFHCHLAVGFLLIHCRSKIITINNCRYCHCCCHLVAGALPIH